MKNQKLKKLVPELRFGEFEGEWKNYELQNIASVIMGQSPAGESYNTHGEGVALINGPVEFTDRYPVKVKWTNKPTKYCQTGDILFCVRGSSTGRMNIANDKYCIGRGVCAIRSTNQNITDFIRYILVKYLNEILSLTAGSTFINLDSKSLKQITLPFPKPAEQQKIATFLTTIDRRIQLLEEKATQLEAYKKGIMQQLFDRTLRFKDENGEDFGEWEEKRLGEVLTIGNGKDYKHLKIGNIPVYGTGGYMTSVSDYLHDGKSVCIGRKGTIDKPFFLSEKFWTVDTLFYTHSFKNILAEFVFIVFQQINWQQYNEASGVPSLSKSTISKIVISVPSLLEQQKIANFFTKIDDRINTTNAQIEQMKIWKKGLLQKMFV